MWTAPFLVGDHAVIVCAVFVGAFKIFLGGFYVILVLICGTTNDYAGTVFDDFFENGFFENGFLGFDGIFGEGSALCELIFM